MKKLFLLTQSDNNGYDTFDSCIVCAASLADAVLIHPAGIASEDNRFHSSCWARSPKSVKAKYIGDAAPGINLGVVLASFNAG